MNYEDECATYKFLVAQENDPTQCKEYEDRERYQMKTLSIRETRQALSQLDHLLAEEGEMIITRRGQPIARIVQIDKKRLIPSHRSLRESMPRLRKGSEKIVRADRDSR